MHYNLNFKTYNNACGQFHYDKIETIYNSAIGLCNTSLYSHEIYLFNDASYMKVVHVDLKKTSDSTYCRTLVTTI